MTTQCLSFPGSFSFWFKCCVDEAQPCSSTLVPAAEKLFWKKSVMSTSSVFERSWGVVGRRTAMEPPWLVRVELPLHMVERSGEEN